MYLRMARRLLLETDKRLLWKLAYNFGFQGMLSVERFKRRMKRGEFFPPFIYISVINSCNLRCQGCWVDVSAKQQIIDAILPWGEEVTLNAVEVYVSRIRSKIDSAGISIKTIRGFGYLLEQSRG